MAFFSSESKEEKKAKKLEALLDFYGLQDLSDPRDLESVRSITDSLVSSNLAELGAVLGSSGAETAIMSYLRAIIGQNWIIIRQLDRLNNK